VGWSWQHLQLKELGGLIQSTIEAGEENGVVAVAVQVVASGELHAVVAPKTKNVSKSPSCFYQMLADLNNCEMIPAIDQTLSGHSRHGLYIGDPTDRNSFSAKATFHYLIRAGLTDEQFDEGTCVAEKDNQLSPGLPSRFH
jgi:hypothetical protein